MKPAKGGVTPKQSCSCTSCLYRSESDRPSLRKIIAHGSKIDKLYYGKYIPLRERKLLGKLVRTRAVYDDIRNQLLSGSSTSVSQADLKPRKNIPTKKPNKDTQKGDDIPTLVDLVDKGNVLLPENSSECCSCCICDSKLSIHDETLQTRMHKHKRRAGPKMTSKSSVISRDRAGEDTKMGRAVHFKTKHIRSDPCTCTYKLRDMMKRHSKSVLKKLRKHRPEPVLEPLAGAPEQTKPKKDKTIRKSVENVKQSKTRLLKSMQEGTRKSITRLKETKSKIKENVETAAKKSLEKIQETKQRIQEKMKTSKINPELSTPKPAETEDKAFKIRKDSLTKFREKLRKKRDLKDWECDFECHPEECLPEECFKIIKQKRLRKIKDTAARRKSTSNEKKIGDKPKVSEVSVQAQKIKKVLKPNKKTTRKIVTAKTQKLDRSCVCVEIKKNDVKHTQKIRLAPTETKPKTSVIKKPSKVSPQGMPTEPTRKEESKISKQSRSGVKVENLKAPDRIEDKIKQPQIPQKARQAVRVGSSFSFNIEFYKERPILEALEMKTRQEVKTLIKERRNKNGHSFAKNVHKRDKSSETALNQSVKNIQAFGHPLKRCFCTLKLKPRTTKITLNANKSPNKKCVCPCTSPVIAKTETESVTESIQTNKNSELPYVLEPYECEPICIPDECNPIECEKRIRKRNKRKRHSVSIYTKKQMKSSSSITSKSVSSTISRGLQVQPVRKSITQGGHKEPAATMSVTPVGESSSPPRQAVRIGSTFSFQIDFFKDSGLVNSPVIYTKVLNTPPTIKTEQIAVKAPTTEKGVPRAKRYIRHKYSQISSSTKTKFTTQKHKLRRCFCTLKFNKTEKKKKVVSNSKGTITSGQSMAKTPEPKQGVRTVSMETNKVRKNKVMHEPQLLPYECEPGICNPGDCDPYKCLEFIKRREMKELSSKANSAHTDYRKTKSTSSFAPNRIIRSRTKKVQSTLVAYKGKVPSSVSSEKKPQPRQSLETSEILNRQAVRIGSSFNFNVEFYKDKPVKEVPLKIHQPPKKIVKQEKKLKHLTERGSQIVNVTQHKSVLMQAVNKRKNISVGPAMKRCFCTLKLRKPAKETKKDVITVGTKTPKFKTKQPKFSELKPYECEPFVCTPGECNPYECLERIKMRNVRPKSKVKGVIANPSKMKSISSSIENVHIPIKDAYAQSKRVEQEIIAKKMKPDKSIYKSDQTPKIQKMYSGNHSRQSVTLGSNFSFNIQFSKDRKPENRIVQIPHERGDAKVSKLLKNRGEQPLIAVMRQHESQVNVTKKIHKSTGVVPILKRCFCTLQLQKKMNNPIKPTQVYTVSRVGVKPSFLHKQIASAKVDSAITSFKKLNRYSTVYANRVAKIKDSEISSFSVLSCSTMQFNSQLVFSNNHNKYAHSISGPIYSQPILRLKAPKPAKSLCIKNPSPTRHIKKFSEISLMRCYGPYDSNIKQGPNEVNAYLRRQVCAMNIQVDQYRPSPLKQKLEPYECEPGVCVPYECDPLLCQARIMKRLMRHASKSAGTQKRIHSASSSTLNANHNSKRLQSNTSVPSPRRKQTTSTDARARYPHSQKQAVRVGSNFSFNIEFSKDKLQTKNELKNPTYYPSAKKRQTTGKKLKHRGTREYLRNQKDRESQSAAKMEHRGSSAVPLLKRCFCTLKLHKKGGREKGIHITDDKGVTVDNDIVTVQTVDSTQNTDPRKYKHTLEPYECEPGICVPGQCDPYQCLELIKERKLRGKDFGTKMAKFSKMSTASMTSAQKKKMKNRCNQLKCKEKRQSAQKHKHPVQSLDNAKPLRQAVRIGSTFSFNVEFFKENPNLQSRPSVTSINVRQKPENEKKRPMRTHDFKERFTQDNTSMRHKDSQSDLMKQKKSTMTSSFIKRCFCTAKLHAIERTTSLSQDKSLNINVKQQSPGSPTFLQRCFCVMKSLTAPKWKSGTPSQTDQESALKSSYEPAAHHLEPYECTPGVCIPGECDPYVCEQLIKRRNAKVCTKETCTGRLRTRSQSSRVQSHKTPRVKETQMTVDISSKKVRPTSSGDFERKKSFERSGSPGRQAVRIGSNFNFNIEFYKDRSKGEMFKDKSLMDHHQRRHRTSDDSKRHRVKTRSRGSFDRKIHRHSRNSQVRSTKTQDRASGVGRLLQRCFCTLNLRKPKVPQKYSETGTQSIRNIDVKDSLNIDTKSVMTVNKVIPHKLEPYECEPNTCIPGQCDPYECEKRIKKRFRREYGTSTVHFKTKSATSMISSARKFRNIKMQSRPKKTRRNRTNTERTKKPRYNKIDLSGTPSRQAVRLGSTFSFNVEFFKEKSNHANVNRIPEPKIRHKDVGHSDRNYRRRSSIPCNTKTCQAKTRMREVDSQVLAKKMRSTMSGVTPFLKRCFCTLKLQRPVARAQHESKKKIIRTQVTTDNKSTYTSNKFDKSQAPVRVQYLDPYECEPGICVPGECDPYECDKRIKMRYTKRHSVSSNTDRNQDTSKYVSARPKHKGRKSHATTIPHERQTQKVTMSDIPRTVVQQSDLQPAYRPHRQAVRIGSNFSFDIEFDKDKSANDSSKQQYPQTISYKSDSVNRKFKESSKLKTRNTGAGNRGISFYHRKSQAHGPKRDTKGSGMGPFLKRCFCTLKLQKQDKQQYHSSVRLQADHTPQPSSFDASTETKKQRRVLEPYECEPNVCVPGFCDPHECLRRIKRRQMKELGVETDNPSMKSDYSLTSRRSTRDQSLKTNHFKEKKPQRNVSFEKESHGTKRHSVANENLNRQAVRIGSSFKFDIEFYKQSSTANDQGHGDGQTYDISPTRENKERTRKSKSRGSQDRCTSQCQGVQMERTQRQSRGSGMGPLLKRCFCTLALQNNSKQPVVQKQTKTIEETKTKDVCTQSICANKSKSLPYALDPYECEPNVCVPGECDPYECYERIKRRNARYKSKGLGTDTKRYSQVSSNTGHGKYSQSKRTQSAVLGKHRRQHKSSSINESMVVEQPRLQMLSDIANRNVVKIGSNISFNIEFYKEVTPAAAEMNYTNKRRDSEVTIDTKQKNTYKTTRYHSRDSQAQTPKTQNKGSFVSNALKRCFCTAQLHKSNSPRPKIGTNKECVECKPKSIFGQQQYQVYYHKASFKKKPSKRCVCTTCDDKVCQNTKATSTKSKRLINLNRRSTAKNKKTQNANEMETILPYAPNKFNKKASKTLFARNNNKGIIGDDNEYCVNVQCPRFKKGTIAKSRKLKKSKSTKKLNVVKMVQPDGKDEIISTPNNLKNKSFLCRCKELFSGKKNTIETCVEICPLCKSEKTNKEPEFKQAENLKKTKSERRQSKSSKKEPKKSKSLKINNQRELEEVRQDYSQFQSGDTKRKVEKRTSIKKRKSKVLSNDYKTDRLRCADDYLYLYVTDLNQKLIKDNKKQVKFSDLNKDSITASPNLTPKAVQDKLLKKQKHHKTKGALNLEPMKANCLDDSDSYLDIVLQPSRCSGTKMEGIAAITFKGDNKIKSKSRTKRKSTMKDHPLQEDTPCPPGTCRKKTIGDESKSMQPGASLRIAARGSKKGASGGKCDIEQVIETLTKNINAIKNAKSRVLNTMITKEQICACYSSVCECAKAIREEKERAHKIEMELENEKHILKEKEKKRKEAEKEAKQKQKEFWLRQKRHRREDELRRRKRTRDHKLLEKRLKNVKTSDVVLAAESILDIAKLGCTVVGDVARSTCRFVTDPGYSIKKMKTAARDPGSMIKKAVDDSGLVATLKRVFMRVTAMKGIKTVKSGLEQNEFTGYLMHMAESDPRKRMNLKKKKQAKKKEPALDDFECSLYMASLRRKRFIAVYYLCPWFYPHFITLLNVVEQVTDLILFLLAVFVWSPCILCMELCRAFVCCFLCTG